MYGVLPLSSGRRAVIHDMRVSRLDKGRYIDGDQFLAIPLGATAVRNALYVTGLNVQSGEPPLRSYRFDADGTLSWDRAIRHPNQPQRWQPARVAYSAGHFVALDGYTYDVLVYDTTGRTVRHWKRTAPWFKAGEDRRGFPWTSFLAVHAQDSLAVVVAAVRTADEVPRFDSIHEFEKQHRIWLEVFDFRSGVVLVSQSVAGIPFMGSLGSHRVYALREGRTDGLISVEFLNVALSLRNRR